MYKNIAKFDNDYLAKAQALPQNTSADGNGGSFRLAGMLGAIGLVGKVNAEISLADTKVLTVKLQDSADNTTFADVVTLYTKTASGATTIAADTELFRYIPTSSLRTFAKVVITTTDTSAAGKVDVFQSYNAR